MRRIESDPDEQRQIEEALARHATPTHEQPTEEFDSTELARRLAADRICRSLRPAAHILGEFGQAEGLADIPSLPDNTWTAEQEAWTLGIEEEH